MSKLNDEARVIPAQLDFLTIYNTTLSDSDEDLKQQILFYYSRSALQQGSNSGDQRDEAADAEKIQNERVRQIGLAQGMVNFAKTFSVKSNVDTVETEKSRIVLYELETNWWILAAIDLTRLPSARVPQDNNTKRGLEYSAREVSSAQLLLIQLIRANSLFLLHHASRLSELLDRVGRDTCCALLERFWNSFVRDWDVLLHGNPAATIYNATKLSGGGELGIGVGEEEWGSGEREVLEDFIDRTEGLRDVVVGRYGVPPEIDRANATDSKPDLTAWLGTGNDPVASDGIIFSGRGLVSKQSLRTISQWMEEIFKHGENAYGVGENPSAPRRSRPRRRKVQRTTSDELSSKAPDHEIHPKLQSPRRRAPDLRKQAIENNASPPGIPAPLVGQVERSLDEAIAKATARSPSGSPKQEKTQAQAMSDNLAESSSTSTTDSMMKFLTLGYGTSWTLNPKGLKPKSPDAADHRSRNDSSAAKPTGANRSATIDQGLQEIDPTPEVSEDDQPDFKQKLEQSIGKFLIGLSGDLEQTELDGDGEDGTLSTSDQRIFLRILTIETAQPRNMQRNTTIRRNSIQSVGSANSKGSAEPKTSAAASVDGSTPIITREKVQVAVYVHQPFIFVFLFSLHTPSLTMPAFYRRIHNQLGPLQKPLLRSTDVSRVAERIAEAVGEKSSTSSPSGPQQVTSPIYDLTYDPVKMTIRTSIPNIPIPGSLAAEGLTTKASSSLSISGSWYTLGIPIGNSLSTNTASPQDNLVKSAWSRTEALNVHTQILNTYATTRSQGELEHTAKTARGWWILWMKVSDTSKSSNHGKGQDSSNDKKERSDDGPRIFGHATHKEAFLVRRAADYRPNLSAQPRTLSSGPGRWLLREQKREASGASASSGPSGTANVKGVSEGVGVDAKKWVEGLLTLTR